MVSITVRNIKITDDLHECTAWCKPPKHVMVARSKDERWGGTPEFWNLIITGEFVAAGEGPPIRVTKVERAYEDDGFDAEGEWWPVSWLLTLEPME